MKTTTRVLTGLRLFFPKYSYGSVCHIVKLSNRKDDAFLIPSFISPDSEQVGIILRNNRRDTAIKIGKGAYLATLIIHKIWHLSLQELITIPQNEYIGVKNIINNKNYQPNRSAIPEAEAEAEAKAKAKKSTHSETGPSFKKLKINK